jgi:hypothetical protein
MNAKDFMINGVLIVASNYNLKGFYEFYNIHGQLTATITSKRLKLSKDNAKAWQRLATLFSD